MFKVCVGERPTQATHRLPVSVCHFNISVRYGTQSRYGGLDLIERSSDVTVTDLIEGKH
jgi:hypothetical protein